MSFFGLENTVFDCEAERENRISGRRGNPHAKSFSLNAGLTMIPWISFRKRGTKTVSVGGSKGDFVEMSRKVSHRDRIAARSVSRACPNGFFMSSESEKKSGF